MISFIKIFILPHYSVCQNLLCKKSFKKSTFEFLFQKIYKFEEQHQHQQQQQQQRGERINETFLAVSESLD